jgi:hypothetical protein
MNNSIKKIYIKDLLSALITILFVCTYQLNFCAAYKSNSFDYELFKEKCLALPSYLEREKAERNPLPRAKDSGISLEGYIQLLDAFFKLQKTDSNPLLNHAAWLAEPESVGTLFHDTTDAPFVQKLTVPAGTIIGMRGDLHGDIHSLLGYLEELANQGYLDKTNKFKICRPDFYLIFLGDYVDRGLYGIETISALLQLKLTNPDQVILLRGNHETVALNYHYGFFAEFFHKYGAQSSIEEREEALIKTAAFYNFLPVALYLGSSNDSINGAIDYVQCCHGGLEPLFNAQELLDSPSSKIFQWVKKDPTCPLVKEIAQLYSQEENLLDVLSAFDQSLGFLWSDFIVDPEPLWRSDANRGIAYGKKITQALLQAQSSKKRRLAGVMRGHQHSNSMTPMMASIIDPDNKTDHKGLSKLWRSSENCDKELWNGVVCTFLVAPNSAYSCQKKLYDFDAFSIMITAPLITDWSCSVTRIPVQKN